MTCGSGQTTQLPIILKLEIFLRTRLHASAFRELSKFYFVAQKNKSGCVEWIKTSISSNFGSWPRVLQPITHIWLIIKDQAAVTKLPIQSLSQSDE